MFFFFMSIRLFFFYFLCFPIHNNVCPKYCQRTLKNTIDKKKNRKSLKQAEIITYQPKSLENKNIVGIKSVITEYLKTLN